PELINSCLELMEKLGLDFHFTLRVLSETGPDNWTDTELNSTLNKPEFIAWLREYQQRIALDYSNDQERQNAMQGVNPKYILRTHLAQEAIEKVENGEFEILETWLTVLANPFIDHACPSHCSLPPSNDQKGICLSCSS
ncbi:protein adenylyltransferase SelO family protein, partial [Vibrio sp. 10N.261.49.C12]|uniref:protein adenylyltransferase SelO family protein n=1 Tax=Vibrio sp. 10N.261.49.C12 TaxID=3229671 RepID=UPI00354D266F